MLSARPRALRALPSARFCINCTRQSSSAPSSTSPESGAATASTTSTSSSPTTSSNSKPWWRSRKHITSPQSVHPNWKASKIIFSGIQPTGIPHLGNYLGALRQWVKLQDESSTGDTNLIFSIVDLHAITARQKPDQLRQWRREMLLSLMAVGLSPQRSLMFCQSSVSAHSELMWILSCMASMGHLSRMTQWKSKMQLPADASPLETTADSKSREALKLGLFSYPVLQAADILLYGTTHVPVGEDQAQHLEFTRELANSFNHAIMASSPHLKQGPVVPPETILSPAKRVMSLTNPTNKMSKSDPNENSRILISDSKEIIHKKIKSALTDSITGVTYDRETRPGVTNLIDIMYYMDESVAETPQAIAKDMENVSMRALKEKVADTINAKIWPVRERYKFLEDTEKSKPFLGNLNEEAARQAKKYTKPRLNKIKSALGFGRMGVV